MSGRPPSRGLVIVLLIQLVIATAFIVLVATDSIPLPSAAAGPAGPTLAADGKRS